MNLHDLKPVDALYALKKVNPQKLFLSLSFLPAWNIFLVKKKRVPKELLDLSHSSDFDCPDFSIAILSANQDVIRVTKGSWTFSEISKGGVDIHTPQVKIGLNFRKDRAGFGSILRLDGS